MRPAGDIDVLSVLLLPIALRRSRMLAYVGTLLSPVGRLIALYDNYRIYTGYAIAHNAQVCKLRALLNDLLDAGQRRITISDAEPSGDVIMLYDRTLGSPLYVDGRDMPTMIYGRGYNPSEDINFVVSVPRDWQDNDVLMARLQALVNTYKLASKRYIITYK